MESSGSRPSALATARAVPAVTSRFSADIPVELSSGNFDQHVGKSDLPVVVDFWAPWCGPCRMMAPAYEETAQRMEPHVRFAKLNTEEAQDVAARFGIRSIPTLIVFKGGREVSRQSGAMGAEQLSRWVASAIA